MKQLQPDRQILAMTDTELEQFVRDWVELKKKDYVEIERFTGPGDRGRDPAGHAVMVKWFGKDPGAAPVGEAPASLETREMPYVRQLLDAYPTLTD
jgi:hypothetical protein